LSGTAESDEGGFTDGDGFTEQTEKEEGLPDEGIHKG
jgi:hypothetical protein